MKKHQPPRRPSSPKKPRRLRDTGGLERFLRGVARSRPRTADCGPFDDRTAPSVMNQPAYRLRGPNFTVDTNLAPGVTVSGSAAVSSGTIA